MKANILGIFPGYSLAIYRAKHPKTAKFPVVSSAAAKVFAEENHIYTKRTAKWTAAPFFLPLVF